MRNPPEFTLPLIILTKAFLIPGADQHPALCNGRRLRCRSCSVTAAASAARFLFVPSELPPLWALVLLLRPALFCGPLFLSILNYRTANCPRLAAQFYVGVECPAALFYISAQPIPSIFGLLFIAHRLLVINGELSQFALYHQRFMWLPCFCYPCRTPL
jgi:hypothetical protein